MSRDYSVKTNKHQLVSKPSKNYTGLKIRSAENVILKH